MEPEVRPHQEVAPTTPIAGVEELTQPIDSFGRIVFLVIILEIILMAGLNLYEKSRLNTITQDLNTKQQQLASADYATLNSQVNDVLGGQAKLQAVLSAKLNWSNFYTMLDAVTPKDVRLTSISISESGAFKASGETSTLTSLARAMTAWQKGVTGVATPFTSLALNNDGYTTDSGSRRVTFSVSGQVNLGSLGGN